MNRYLLLILLSSWAHVVPLSLECETGVAHAQHVLSVAKSSMANADVAILKTYKAESLDKCINDCCTEKFGSCTVASFRKTNDTEENCQHFNCRPLHKCIFLSSNTTDSFTFSSSSSNPLLVPSSNASKNDSLSTIPSVTTPESKLENLSQNNHKQHAAVTEEAVASFSEDPFSLKDDNTTIKPRKGVYDVTEISFESVSRSGVKPRKGVVLDGIVNSNNSKSKVKPRKGVGPFQSQTILLPKNTVLPSKHVSTVKINPTTASSISTNMNTIADDIVSALEKVFEDDSKVNDAKSSIVPPITSSTTETSLFSSTLVNAFTSTSAVSKDTSTDKPQSILQTSLTTNHIVSSSVRTPDLVTPTTQTNENFGQYFQPLSSRPSIFEHSKLLFHESDSSNDLKSVEDQGTYAEESESERKYKSSMHLLLSLVFGLLVLFSVLGVIAKRVYDSWMRRHYRRMDFLIDGMYNGYG